VSTAIGLAAWAKSRDIRALLVSLVFGVLVDVDHGFDYLYSERRLNFNLREFLASRYWHKSGRIFILFHAFEYLPLVYFGWRMKGRKWSTLAAAAMFIHVLIDLAVNDLRLLAYFIVYRVAHGFRAADVINFERRRHLDARLRERESRRLAKQSTVVDRVAAFFW